jgi:hypothetical protein
LRCKYLWWDAAPPYATQPLLGSVRNPRQQLLGYPACVLGSVCCYATQQPQAKVHKQARAIEITKIRLPLAQNKKQSRFLNKGCLVSFCDSFSTQALQVSQGKTEAQRQDKKYPLGDAGLVCHYPSYPTGLITSCNNYNPPRTGGGLVRGCKYKNKNFNSYLAGLFEGDGHIWFPNFNWKKKQ